MKRSCRKVFLVLLYTFAVVSNVGYGGRSKPKIVDSSDSSGAGKELETFEGDLELEPSLTEDMTIDNSLMCDNILEKFVRDGGKIDHMDKGSNMDHIIDDSCKGVSVVYIGVHTNREQPVCVFRNFYGIFNCKVVGATTAFPTIVHGGHGKYERFRLDLDRAYYHDYEPRWKLGIFMATNSAFMFNARGVSAVRL